MRIWTKMPRLHLEIKSFATEDLEIACREYKLHAYQGIFCSTVFALALISKPTATFSIATMLLVAGVVRCLELSRRIRAELELRTRTSQQA